MSPHRILVVPFVALALATCSPPKRERPQHFVLVTVDTLRADHLSAWGSTRGTSDAAHARERGSELGFTLDELAAQGTRFAQAYTVRGETFPSLCALFTGKPPPETGVLGNAETLPASATTLAERLRAAGMRTAAFTTNKLLVPRSGIEQGFEELTSDFGDERDAKMLDAAAAWLEQHADERAFAWVHLMGPHLPYEPRPSKGVDFAKLYADPTYAGTANGSREYVDRAYVEQRALSAADVAAIVALYDGEIARVDQLVSAFARRLAAPDARGAGKKSLLDRSLFVVCADHGEELHERNGYFGHSKSVSSAVLHVPLFLRWSGGVAANAVRDEIVTLEDLFPTVLELFGLDAEKDVRAPSLATLCRGEHDARFDHRLAVGLWRDRIFTIADAHRRLTWNPDEIEPAEVPPGPYPIARLALHDRDADPMELVDAKASDRDRADAMLAELRKWLRDLRRSTERPGELTPERLKALIDQGYAGGK